MSTIEGRIVNMTRHNVQSSSNVLQVLIVLAERNVKVIASAVQMTMFVGPRTDDPRNLTSTRLALEILFGSPRRNPAFLLHFFLL